MNDFDEMVVDCEADEYYRQYLIDNKIWTKKDGTEIPVEEMSTEHIKNTLAMLERNGFCSKKEIAFFLLGHKPQGDAAQIAYDMEFNEKNKKFPMDWVDIFQDELRFRNEAN